MESLSQQLENLNLSDNFYTGQGLSNEETFLEDLKKLIHERLFEAHQCSFYFGKRIMTFSVELSVSPTRAIAKVLLNTIEETFTKEENLYKIGWCSSYMIDKRYHRAYLVEFAWLNTSPNCKVYVKEGEKQKIIPFSLCSCFSCQEMLKCLS